MSNLQQIDLYSDSFKPQVEPLMAKHLLVLAVVFLLVLTGISGVSAYQNTLLQDESDKLNAEVAATEKRLEVMRAQQLLKQKPQVDTEIEDLQRQVVKRKQISTLIRNQNLGNAKGFSFQLTAMAEQSLASVSLSAFSLQQGGAYAEMSGWTKQAEAVPYYLQRLRQKESFQKVRMGVLSLERQDGDALSFSLSQPELEQEETSRTALLPTPLSQLKEVSNASATTAMAK